jgi:hypothetical protein
MPKYYFDVNGAGVPDHDEGDMLQNDDAAWHEATLVAGELFKEVDGKLKPGEGWKIDVLNEQRQPIYSIIVMTRTMK